MSRSECKYDSLKPSAARFITCFDEKWASIIINRWPWASFCCSCQRTIRFCSSRLLFAASAAFSISSFWIASGCCITEAGRFLCLVLLSEPLFAAFLTGPPLLSPKAPALKFQALLSLLELWVPQLLLTALVLEAPTSLEQQAPQCPRSYEHCSGPLSPSSFLLDPPTFGPFGTELDSGWVTNQGPSVVSSHLATRSASCGASTTPGTRTRQKLVSMSVQRHVKIRLLSDACKQPKDRMGTICIIMSLA